MQKKRMPRPSGRPIGQRRKNAPPGSDKLLQKLSVGVPTGGSVYFFLKVGHRTEFEELRGFFGTADPGPAERFARFVQVERNMVAAPFEYFGDGTVS